MQVELITYTMGCEDVVERAAAVCYDSTPTPKHRIAASCARSGHMSVWEHLNFTFHISEVSRALLAQLSRHRHISLSVRSQRYCSEGEFSYVMPLTVEGNQSAKKEMFGVMYEVGKSYRSLQEKGIPNEDARAVLPNACCTELYMTCNARALIEMSHLRLCSRAQEEIRELFRELKKGVGSVSPMVAAMMVPKCEQFQDAYFCTEEKGCGKHPKLQDIVKNEE